MTTKMNQPTFSKRENSWYLKTGHIHHFICKCGQVDQFGNIVSTIHHPGHCCKSCGNRHYLDSVMFLSDKKVVRWSTFNWNVETRKTNDAWIVGAYASIPSFDLYLQKITFGKIAIATNKLLFSGKHEYRENNTMIMKKYVYNHAIKATLIKELIAEELKERLYTFVISSPIDKVVWVEDKALDKWSISERIKLLSFFLENDHLKEYDFFSWKNFETLKRPSKQYPSIKGMLSFISNHREEKSIRKAHFESYIESMKIHSSYNFMTDYIFTHHIEDRNFLLKLIQMDPEVKHIVFKEVAMVTIEDFLVFLKEHYTQKAITELFTDLSQNTFVYRNIVRDTLWMCIGEHMDFIREHFRKVPLNFQRLHDEFIRINTMRDASLNGKIMFEYQENDLSIQTKKDHFEYRLPETIHVLQQWSQQLHNCMYGYSRAIHQGHTIIYGVFKEDILTYAIEIRQNKIVQALGKYNRPMEVDDRAEIDVWFMEDYLGTWMKFPGVSQK